MRIGIVALLALLACAAQAQVFEMGGFGGTHLIRSGDLGTSEGVPVSLTNGWMAGFRMAFNTRRFFGHETGYSYNRTTMDFGGGKAGTAVHRGFYNFLVYAMPEGYRVRVFGAGGFHFATYAFPGYSAASGGGSTRLGLNYGGGVKVMVTPLIGIRLDFRDYRNPKPFSSFFQGVNGWMSQLEFSAGMQLLL